LTIPFRTAACVVGAVRSLLEADVRDAFQQYLLNATHVDVFFYLFVGEEISVKGQKALQLAKAIQLRQFTAQAIEAKIQMVENNFSCGQMSTGSFYKIARCAQMVEQHARQHAVHYTSLLLTRPDMRLLGQLPTRVPSIPRWMSLLNSETYFLDYNAGIRLSMSLPQAMCCDPVRRTPRGCFVDALVEPDVAFMKEHHFMRHMHLIALAHVPARIVRSSQQVAEIAHRSCHTLHGKYRDHVELAPDPPSVSADEFVQTLLQSRHQEAAEIRIDDADAVQQSFREVGNGRC